MKKQLFFLVFALTGFLITGPSVSVQASVMGAELTYINTGPSTFQVRYKMFWDCSTPPPAGNTVQLTYQASGCHAGGTLTLNRVSQSVAGINPCDRDCVLGIATGQVNYRSIIYTQTITLPAACSNWVLSVNTTNRMADNLDSAASQAMYTETRINNQAVANNNSVIFGENPVVFACQNQPFTLHPLPVNIDGDSVAFSLQTPLIAANAPATFLPGYSAALPLGVNANFAFNAQTGVITFNSAAAVGSRFAFRLKTTEFRMINSAWVNVGETNQDIMVILDSCPVKQPLIFSTPGQSVDSLFFFRAGVPQCFSIAISNPDSLAITWVSTNLNQIIPIAPYSVSGGADPVFRFCWRPDAADIGKIFAFNLTGRDNTCPMPMITTKIIRVRVVKNKITNPGPAVIADPNQPGALRQSQPVPNIITPNGDGINEAFVIPDLPENADLQIFDRNRKLVRSIKRYQNNWNAEGLKEGIYYYILKDKATGEVTKGEITVIR